MVDVRLETLLLITPCTPAPPPLSLHTIGRVLTSTFATEECRRPTRKRICANLTLRNQLLSGNVRKDNPTKHWLEPLNRVRTWQASFASAWTVSNRAVKLRRRVVLRSTVILTGIPTSPWQGRSFLPRTVWCDNTLWEPKIRVVAINLPIVEGPFNRI